MRTRIRFLLEKCFLATKLRKMQTLERVIENNKRSEEILSSLNSELFALRKELCLRRKEQLIQENAELLRQIDATKAQLITLETKNGKRQYVLPGRNMCTQATNENEHKVVGSPSGVVEQQLQQSKVVKEKKPKKEKPTATAAAAEVTTDPVIDVGRLDMRVGKIIEINRHPDADSLYVEKIDCGEVQPRTVVSGLVKFIPIEEMKDRLVIVLCNLKPAKMRGITSEAMVMCASTPEKVEVLSPPTGAVPGDLVHCEGYTRNPDVQLNPKKKIFETCAPDLKTNEELIACYKDASLHVPGKGKIVSQTLKNVQVK